MLGVDQTSAESINVGSRSVASGSARSVENTNTQLKSKPPTPLPSGACAEGGQQVRSAVALSRTETGWSARDVDLDDVETLDDLIDQLDDLEGNLDDVTVVFVEEDDEWLGVLRVTVETLQDPRIFLSDSRVLATSDLAERLFGDALPVVVEANDEEDEETSGRPDASPVGDVELLADLGTAGDVLVQLIAEEGALPSDVVATLCERSGSLDVLEELRGVS